MDHPLTRRTVLATAGAALAAGALPPAAEPELVAADNALTGLQIGVQRAGFVVDRLTFNRSRRAGQQGEQLRAEVIAAARNALFFTAVGSSDDHDAIDWATNGEHNITYVWAPSKSRADLLAALRRGAAWFTDLARYRGTMDLRIGGVSRLGAVLIARTAAKVDVIATAVPSGATVEIVTGVVDEAGAVPSIEISKGTSASVPPGHYVRTQVRLSSGEIVGASNPLWVLAAEPKQPIPPGRLRKAK